MAAQAPLVCALFIACTSPDPSNTPVVDYDPLPLVDLSIGTGGLGGQIAALNPGAAVPFGMTQTGPDTRGVAGAPSFLHFGGYYWYDDHIDAFSHTHANGMGVNDFGGVAVMPRAEWRDEWIDKRERSAPFSHETETARPGSYEVELLDDGTLVQIAATTRGAVHRYRFKDTSAPVVMIDMGHELGTVTIDGSSVAREGATFTGYQLLKGSYSGRLGGLHTWVHATLDPEPVTSGVWSEIMQPTQGDGAEGDRVGMWMTFPAGTKEVTLRLAISYTSADGAKTNHDAEVANRSFDQTREAAERAWREEMSSVRVRGGTDDDNIIFHTALYHAYLWPNVYQDADGTYRGFDGELHVADHDYYSNFSLWDTFRTTHPWFTLARPTRHQDMLRSLLLMAEQGGTMPRWPLGHGYTGGMVGSPGSIVFAEAHLKGLGGYDSARALALSAPQALGPVPHGRSGITSYREMGYVSIEDSSGAASRTLEFAWADHATALWAQELGQTDLYDELNDQSGNWRNTWDAQDHFFRGRYNDGTFERGYNPLGWSDDFVEGTAWQYVYGVPFDVPGMIELQNDGDGAAFSDGLDEFWRQTQLNELDADIIPDSYYWHGNEPDLHFAFVAGMAGDRDGTSRAARWVLADKYHTGPDGLDGNDDAGTLSSWYLFASSGIYPIAGTADYALGSPVFERIEIGELVIRARGQGIYTHDLSLGDEPTLDVLLDHRAMMDAGELVFTMDTTPFAP